MNDSTPLASEAAAPLVHSSIDPALDGFYELPPLLHPPIDYTADATQRRVTRLSVTEGALATAMGTLISGVFLTGFALNLGASRFAIGILAALPALANMAQLLGAFWLRRYGHRKAFCVGSLAASRAIWLSILAVPWLLDTRWESTLVWWLVGLVAISHAFSALGGVAWLSWIKDLIPEHKRLGFLGLRNQFDTVLALALSIAGAIYLDWWAAEFPGSLNGFLTVLTVAVICGLIGIPILRAIPDPGSIHETMTPAASGAASIAAHQGNFRRLVFFYAFWNLSSNLATPFFTVYLIEQLSLPFWHITGLYTLAALVGLFANRYWTRLGNRYGTRPVVFLATLGDALFPLWWLFLSPTSTWALPLIFLSGAFNPPLAIGAPALVMKTAPRHDASLWLGMFNAIMGPVMAVAAVVGGYLASADVSVSLAFTSVSSSGIKLVFLLSFIGRLMSLFLLTRVAEPGAMRIATIWTDGLASLRSKYGIRPSVPGAAESLLGQEE